MHKLQITYEQLLETIQDGIWVYDADLNTTFVNPKMAEIIGYEVEEMIGKPIFVFLNEEGIENVKSRKEKRKSGISETYEEKLKHKMGHDVYVEIKATPIIDGEGNLNGGIAGFTDITERKQTEEALRESEANYRFLAENMGDVAWVMDLELNTTYISPSSIKVFGFTPEERIQQTVDQIMPPESFIIVAQKMQEELAKAENDSYEIESEIMLESEFYHKNGGTVWLESLIKAIRDSERKVTGIYGTSRDITERKKAEVFLRESEALNKSIVNAIPDIIFKINIHGVYLDVITSDSEKLFMPKEKMVGKTFAEILPKDPAETIVKSIEKAFNKNALQTCEYLLDVPSGLLYFEARIVPIDKTNAYMLIRDISERKEAETSLRESEQRYREILETMEEGFYDVDLKGKIIACNRAATKMLGYGEMEIVGKSYKLLVKDPEAVFHEFNQAFTTVNSKFSVVMEMIRKDGSLVTADLSISLTRDQQGNITGFRGLGRDITNRITMEKHLEHLSFHDQLTGLYNRRYFENELKRLGSSREHPIAVISADLDGLKLVNDTLGHAEGDRYLQAGADLLKSALRASDILARVGGDEFALLLPRTDKVAAEMLVNRIRRKLEQYNLEQTGLPLSISLGLAVSESADYPLEEIYRLADNNMYTDKLQQGKKARAEIVSSLLSSLFERGNLAEGERDQVQELAIRLGQALKLPEDQMARLALFAQVYDLGIVALPDSVIHSSMQSNTGGLTSAEREALHRHPEIGYRIASSSPDLADVADLVLKHHENYDGKGYPLGLKGNAIPIECRILSVAVSYSAMTNPRAYAKTLNHADALAELQRCAGSQFDPEVVEAFFTMMA
jgi:diguanylate cyclase (GGDEF)-like protein/PAS domain S-box-containing protein